jgi:fimbrial chaperone protein
MPHLMRLVLLLAPLLLLPSLAAHAAEFQLSPTRVQLAPRHLVDTVVVGNSGATPLRFEVSVKRWHMAADGSWQLVPSDDLIVHPLLLEIPAGEKARLRVGQLEPSQDPEEAAYRIELDEQEVGRRQSNSVRMLTRISLPVFVRGDAQGAPSPSPSLQAPQWHGGALAFAMHNAGGSFLPPQTLDVQVRAADGTVLAAQALQDNYVLAGATLPLRMRMTPAACARASELRVHLEETGSDLRLPLSSRHCQP